MPGKGRSAAEYELQNSKLGSFSYCCTDLYFGLSHERFHKAGEAAVPPAVPRTSDVGLPEAAVRLLAVDVAELVAQLSERVGHVPVHLVLESHLFDRVLALRAVNVIRVISVVLLGALEVRLDVFPAPTGISQAPPLVKVLAVAAEVVEPVQIAASDQPCFIAMITDMTATKVHLLPPNTFPRG